MTGLVFNGTLPVLIEDDDGTLGTGSTVNAAVATIGATTISFAVDLNDNTDGFFTLALQELPTIGLTALPTPIADRPEPSGRMRQIFQPLGVDAL